MRRSVDAIDQQKRAARGAAHALDEAGERAAEHLRTVDRLTEAARRSVGAALAESGAMPARRPSSSSTPGRT